MARGSTENTTTKTRCFCGDFVVLEVVLRTHPRCWGANKGNIPPRMCDIPPRMWKVHIDVGGNDPILHLAHSHSRTARSGWPSARPSRKAHTSVPGGGEVTMSRSAGADAAATAEAENTP